MNRHKSGINLLSLSLCAAVATISFSAEAQSSGGLKPLKKLQKLGKLAPTFKLRTLDGTLVRLDEIAYPGREKRWAKKHPVLLDFFRTDCSPCRRAMPELLAIYNAHQEQGLRVILVALLEEEDGRGKLERYVSENKLPFTIVVDPTEHFSKKYMGKTVKLPSTFLINRDGRIVSEKSGTKGSLKKFFGASISQALSTNKEANKKP